MPYKIVQNYEFLDSLKKIIFSQCFLCKECKNYPNLSWYHNAGIPNNLTIRLECCNSIIEKDVDEITRLTLGDWEQTELIPKIKELINSWNEGKEFNYEP